jgi:hypothetical protein
VFLRRFLRLGACSAELAPSGLADLDDRLAGGFGFGLHLVLGLPGVGKTAFLESVAWEAVSGERPVLYYTLRDGGSGTWKRLISTLGHIIDGPTIPLDALHAHALSPPDLETLTRLDLVLQASVLPYLSLVETIPAYTDTLSAFIEDVRLRAQEVKEQHGKIPLLLIDDLDRLLLVTRAHPLPLLLSRLDQVLAADSMPCTTHPPATWRDSRSRQYWLWRRPPPQQLMPWRVWISSCGPTPSPVGRERCLCCETVAPASSPTLRPARPARKPSTRLRALPRLRR